MAILGLTPSGEALRMIWLLTARDDQLPPDERPGPMSSSVKRWTRWWMRSGRGAGKTRGAGEWLANSARNYPGTRWAVIAPTRGDTRGTCFEGESGLLSIFGQDEIQYWNRAELILILKNGSRIIGYSSEKPSRLRGPQHHGGWFEEISSWNRAEETLDMAEFGMRLRLPDATPPRVVITSTPKRNAITKKLSSDDKYIITTASTYDNADHLDPDFLERMRSKYEGTSLGDQELYGIVREDAEGAMWSSDTIFFASELPMFNAIRVGWDPAVTSKKTSDAHGIVLAGVDSKGDFYVIEDRSAVQTPEEAAKTCYNLAKQYGATQVIAEDNQGKDTWKTVWKVATDNDPSVTLILKGAKGSKEERAMPLAMHYQRAAREGSDRRVWHAKGTEELVDEMVTWVPAETPKSPNRIDALVWAAWGLGLGKMNTTAVPRQRGHFAAAIGVG